MRIKNVLITVAIAIGLMACSKDVYKLSDYGIYPNSGEDYTEQLANLINTIQEEREGKPTTLLFEPGDYDFYPDKAIEREYYVSKHDQDNPKKVALVLEDISNLTIDGQGANLYMNGRMLPIAMIDCENCTLKNLSVDTRVPQITQATIVENNISEGIIIYR